MDKKTRTRLYYSPCPGGGAFFLPAWEKWGLSAAVSTALRVVGIGRIHEQEIIDPPELLIVQRGPGSSLGAGGISCFKDPVPGPGDFRFGVNERGTGIVLSGVATLADAFEELLSLFNSLGGEDPASLGRGVKALGRSGQVHHRRQNNKKPAGRHDKSFAHRLISFVT